MCLRELVEKEVSELQIIREDYLFLKDASDLEVKVFGTAYDKDDYEWIIEPMSFGMNEEEKVRNLLEELNIEDFETVSLDLQLVVIDADKNEVYL